MKRKKTRKCVTKKRARERENARERIFSVDEEKVSLSNKYTTIENTTD